MNNSSISQSPGLLRVLILLVACTSIAACDRWMSADQRVERARAQFEDGKYRSAMSEVKTVLQNEPQHVPARLLLAELSLWLGDLDGADKELSRALEAGLPKDRANAVRYEILLARGRNDEVLGSLADDAGTPPNQRLVLEARAHGASGNYEQARGALRQALESSPDDPQALLEMARVDAAQGDYARALELTQRITQPELMKARALVLRGSVFRARGEHEQARDALAQALTVGRNRLPIREQVTALIALTEVHLARADTEGANRTLTQLQSWIPDSVATHYLRARVAVLKNDPVAAVAECQRALLSDPNHFPSQMLLAAAHLSHGSLEQAEGVLNGVLATHPKNVAASKLLAQVYLARGEPELAQRALGTVAEEAQADGQFSWLMGQALLQSGDNSGLAVLERGLAATPDDVARRVEVAAAYIAAHVPEKAVELLKSVPANSPVAGRAQALLVVASVSGKGAAEARAEIDRLIAADGNNVALLTAAGAQLASSGDVEKSRSLLERAAQLDPKAVESRWILAQLAAGSRDFDRCGKYLREILAIAPRDERARIGLSELAWREGDRAGAQRMLEEALSANPAAFNARLRLAQIAFVAGDAARGRDLLQQSVSAAVDRKEALNAAGQILARAGLVDEALVKFQEANAAGAPEAALNIARLHLNAGREAETRQALEAALVANPDRRDAQRMLVELDARAGQVDRAVARVHSMRGLSPEGMLEYEGDAYALGKQYDRAVKSFEDAQRKRLSAALAIKIFTARRAAGAATPERSLTDWLQRSPGDAQVRRLLAAYYQTNGRTNEAIGEYERLLAADLIDPVSLNNLAWLLHERSDARALPLAKRAHDAAPQVAEIADTYGWILVQKDKVPEGLEVLERALAGAPANPDIQYHVAAAYVKSGQPARAGQLLRQLLQVHQNFASRPDAEQLARSLPTAGS